MKASIAEGGFVEHAEFGGNMYGTSQMAIKVRSDFLSAYRSHLTQSTGCCRAAQDLRA
jgi:hypothetical protein